MLNKFRRNDKGFTLVELMMVIVILGVLAGVAVPMVGRMRRNALTAKLSSYADSIGTAIIVDYMATKEFPADEDDVLELVSISGDEDLEITVGTTAATTASATGNLLHIFRASGTADTFSIQGFEKSNDTALFTKEFNLPQ